MNVHVTAPPDHTESNGAALQFPFKKDDVVLIGDARRHSRRHVVIGRIASGTYDPSKVHFRAVDLPEDVFLSDGDIALLMAKGEFDILSTGGDTRGFPPLIRSVMSLSDAQKDQGHYHRRCALVMAAIPSEVVNVKEYVAAEVANIAAEVGRKPLSYNTVVKYWRLYQARHAIHGDACLVKPRNPGRRQSKTGKAQEVAKAIDHGIRSAAMLPKGTGEDAVSAARLWVSGNARTATTGDLPGLRTFQRRMQEMDRYHFDALRLGTTAARRKRSAYYETPRPEIPLMEVECDHTNLGVQVYDEEREVVWGRPDLIAFRDRASGIALGYAIGFEAPSYAAFIQGLRHAIYPKQLDWVKNLKNEWPYYGRPKRLYVDNAFHFVGNNIRRAGAQLGMEKVEFRPANPWLKGAQERLLGILEHRLANLPGATQSNPVERKEVSDVEELPALTLMELDAFLTKWFTDVYNVSSHDGLGPLRSLPGVPSKIWESKASQINLGFLPHPDLFTHLIGDVEERTITSMGIEWDYVRYQSGELNAIRTDHRHKVGSRVHKGTVYEVVRDPYDLGHITVSNPYAPEGTPPIRVPAVRQDYAAGLTLHQHRVILANWKTSDLSKPDGDVIDLLQQTRDEIHQVVDALRSRRQKAGTAKLMARWLDGQDRKFRKSIVQSVTKSKAESAAPLAAGAGEEILAPETRSKNAMGSNRDPRDRKPDRRLNTVDVGPDASAVLVDPGKPKSRRPAISSATPLEIADSTDADLETMRSKFPGFDE